MRTPPGREPKLSSIQVGEVTLAMWDWPGLEPALLFAHATSFHGRCWDALVREFPAQHAIAIEARGHGRSSKPAPPYHWNAFGRDLAAVVEGLGIRGAVGIGHSMGGHSLTAVAALRPATFSALLLVDPTIRPPEEYGTPPLDASFIRKRRARWSSPGEMFASYRGRPPFEGWQPEILRDYCEFGLLGDDGGFVLACPPDIEASIYECSKESEANLHSAIPSISIPVTVLRAGYEGDRMFSRSPADPRLASRFRNGEDVLLAGHTHFIPMEAPELVAGHIRRLLVNTPDPAATRKSP